MTKENSRFTGKVNKEEVSPETKEALQAAAELMNKEGEESQQGSEESEERIIPPKRANSFEKLKTRLPIFDNMLYMIVPKYVNERGEEVAENKHHIGVYFNIKEELVTAISKLPRQNTVVINGTIEIPYYQEDYDKLSATEKIYADREEAEELWRKMMAGSMAKAREAREAFASLEKLCDKHLTENLMYE